MADIQGEYDDLYVAVPMALAATLEAGDVGGAVAVVVDGEPVVDVWGGDWQEDTLACVFSVTKTVTALAVLVLADRGEVDLDAPVASYWPEFAAAGKDGVLVRHVLSHSAGLPDWEGPVEELADWDAATARLAATPPQWAPGTAVGYHSLTQGYLLGEVVRRATGRSIDAVVAEEVAGPLGADFHLGLPPELDGRLAPPVPPPGHGEEYVAGSAGGQVTGGTPVSVRDVTGEAWRRALIPAAGGYGNARSVARIQSVVACGGAVGDVRLLSPGMVDRALAEQVAGEDRVLGTGVSWGLGYARFGGTYGWGGWGGSLVMVDPDRRMAVAYTTQQMREPGADTRGFEIAMSAYDRR